MSSPLLATRRRLVVGLATSATLAGLALVGLPASAGPAAFTSVDFTVQPDVGQCVHGNPAVNCNTYSAKQYVWMNGGPAAANLPNGTYYFAVVAPGGQHNPVDGAPKLLSTDTFTHREFSILNGVLTNLGDHPWDSVENKIQLIPFNDTPNNGGVYHMVICSVVGGVQTNDCKSDAFKVQGTGGGGGGGVFSAPTASKTATPVHAHTVHWQISKSADQANNSTIFSGTPVTVNYTITATKTVSNEHWSVGGTISVFNSNAQAMTLDSVDDELAADYPGLGAVCSVSLAAGSSMTVPAGTPAAPGESDFTYNCTVASAPDYTQTYDNRVSITYEDPTANPTTTTVDDAADAIFQWDSTPTLDAGSDPETVTVTDSQNVSGSPGTTGQSISATTTYNYPVTIFNNLCQDYPNTATLYVPGTTPPVQVTGDGTNPTSASWLVTFCGPNAGGLTQGWWQNKNGQALLKTPSSNTTAACTALTGYLGAYTTLSDLINVDAGGDATKQFKTAECTDSTKFSYIPKFDLFVFGLANSSGNGWPMLLSQWLTTALDTVTYTNGKAGGPALGPNLKIYNPANLLNVNNTTNCTTIGQLLKAAVSQFSTYSGNKATVTALSSMFDAINNNIQPSC